MTTTRHPRSRSAAFGPDTPDGFYDNDWDGKDWRGTYGVARWYRPDGLGDYLIAFVLFDPNGVVMKSVRVEDPDNDSIALAVWDTMIRETTGRDLYHYPGAGAVRLNGPWSITKGRPA